MISHSSEFKFFNRSFKNTLVLIPGWATDYRIFSTLDLNYNYLLPIKFYPFDFARRLSEHLKKISLEKVSLFGWSQGGFLACDFATHYSTRVRELILLNVRKAYNPEELGEVKLELKKNKKAYLYKFYLKCFSSYDKEGLYWFRKNLLRKYLDEIKFKDLLAGLDYLS